MAGIKLDITFVGGIRQYADRSLDIEATDRVRGDIVIRMQETEARWLFASLADIVKPWQEADDREL
ncbi:hypothetical protein ACFVXW_25435 [Streptomyces sp. NPDC058251]|uniref:hypothetical protein n=1 Tax=Streptomyces sp. NPDC058251 TaxID=3346404 RepID=UPI0036E3B39B